MPVQVLASLVRQRLSSVPAFLDSWMYLSYTLEEGELRGELGSRDALGTPSGWMESMVDG